MQVHYTLAVRAFQLTGFLAFQLSGKNRSCREQHILTVLWEYVLYMLDRYIYIWGMSVYVFTLVPVVRWWLKSLDYTGSAWGPETFIACAKTIAFEPPPPTSGSGGCPAKVWAAWFLPTLVARLGESSCVDQTISSRGGFGRSISTPGQVLPASIIGHRGGTQLKCPNYSAKFCSQHTLYCGSVGKIQCTSHGPIH